MIYRVLYNGTSIYDEDSSLMLLEPSVETELNSAGSFKFKMNTMHQYYDIPDVLKDDIEIYEDDELIFFGRPISINTDVWKQKEVYCEGPLSFFNDSTQRPYEYQAVSIRTFFTDVVNNHNAQVPANRRFTVGNITIQDKVVYRKLDYQKTFDVIRDMCIDTDGGYIFFRRENGVNYIDWLNGMPYTADQPVEYGLNLVNLTQILDGSDIVTSILPLGDEIDGVKLTVKSVNDGKDYIDAEAASTYGRIIEVVDFQGVTDATTLKTRATEWLTNKQFDRLTFEVEAAELHYIDDTYGPFKVGQTVHVVSTPHLVDKNFPLSKMSVNLNSGVKTITIGTEPRKELTEITGGDTYSGSSSGGSSGGGTNISSIIYSTEERKIGTWIDDESIYEITIPVNTLPNSTSINIPAYMMDKLIYVEGFAYNKNNYGIYVPLPFSGGSDDIRIDVVNNTIKITTFSDWSDYGAYITIRYTKMSENAYGIYNYGGLVGLRPDQSENKYQAQQSYNDRFIINDTMIYKNQTAGNATLILGSLIDFSKYNYLCVDAEVISGINGSYNTSNIGIRYASGGQHTSSDAYYNQTNKGIQFTLYTSRKNYTNTEPWYNLTRGIIKMPLTDLTENEGWISMHACDCIPRIYGIWLE